MSTLLRRTLCVAALLCVIGSDLTRAEPQGMTQAGYPAPGAPATVTLISAGAEPRAALRYKVAAGQTEAMTMTTIVGVTSMMGPMDFPITRMTVSMAVKSVAANGDITFDVSATGMTAEAQPGMDPNMVAMFQGAASQVTALKSTNVVSNRGVRKSGGIDDSKITDPSLKQALSTVSSSLEGIPLPLPEEPVGVGAKWEVRQAISPAGMQSFERIECEITAIQGSSVTIRLKTEQTTPPQNVENPMLPAGATMSIDKMTSTGTGTMTFRLDTLVPTKETSSTSSAVMTLSIGGQTQPLNLDTKVKVSIAPAKN